MACAVQQDVHKLIDDFVRAVLAEGAPLNFKTFKDLWQSRHFGFVHWANAPANAAKTLSTSANEHITQLLFASAVERLSAPSRVSDASVTTLDAAQPSAARSQVQQHGSAETQAPEPDAGPAPGAQPNGSAAEHLAREGARSAAALQTTPPSIEHTALTSQVEQASTTPLSSAAGPNTATQVSVDAEAVASPAEAQDVPVWPGQLAHPFVPIVRRKRLPQTPASATEPRPHKPLRRAHAEHVLDLTQGIPREAQVAAVYTLYACFYTQQCSPSVRVYLGPAAVTALRRVLKMSQDAQVHDAVHMLQVLVADDAFVWGCVDATTKAARSGTASRAGTAATCTVMTDQALRNAVIHLRQAVPTHIDIQGAHAEYVSALEQVFAPHGDAAQPAPLHTMVSTHLPQQLSDRYVRAVREIRSSLGERRTGDAIEVDTLDADMDLELDQELRSMLENDAEAGVADDSGPLNDGARVISAKSGMERAVALSQQRTQKRQAVEQLWQQFARSQH